MSVDQVATALFLHPNTIAALEADSFEHLAAPTFVRGYLRGYARVLGLPSGPILEMYDRQGFEPPPLAPEVTETKQVHTSDPPVRLVTYAVGAVLVLLVGLWWKSQGGAGFGIGSDLSGWWSDPASEPSLPSAGAPGTAPADGEAGGDSIAMAPDQASGPSRGSEPPMPSPAEGTAPTGIPADAAAPVGDEAGDDSLAVAPDQASGSSRGSESPMPSPAEGATPAGIPADAMAPGRASEAPRDDEPPAPSPAAGAAPPGIPADATAPGRASEAPQGSRSVVAAGADPAAGADSGGPGASAVAETARSGLVLTFTHESWVEVYDRERTRLFFGLVQPGRVLDFEGVRPFDVLLGNGQDVRVAIDGEAFDHTPYIRHGVARFSVGSASAGGTDSPEPPDTEAEDATDSRAASSQPPDRDP